MWEDFKVVFGWVAAVFLAILFFTGWPLVRNDDVRPVLLEAQKISEISAEKFEKTVVSSVPATTVVSQSTTNRDPVEPAPSVETTTTVSPSSFQVAPQVSHGTQHTCQLEAGFAVCFGYDYHGETDTSHVGQVKQVVAGDARTCVLDLEGQVWCWGFRTGPNASSSSVPVLVPLPGPALLVSAGLGQECASVAVDGGEEIWCWGEGYDQRDGYTGRVFADTSAPVFMWSGAHVHEIQVGVRTVNAHVGWHGGGCGWISWGEHDNILVTRP